LYGFPSVTREQVKAVLDEYDWNNLPYALKTAISEGLEQLENGKKISYDEVKKRNSRWFDK